MGVFRRMKDMTRAGANNMLDKIEDPVALLNQYIRDMQEEIAKAEVVAAKQMANERMLNQRAIEAAARSAQYERRAEEAVRGGREEEARRCLAEKVSADAQVRDLASFHAQSKAQADELLRRLQELKDEFYRMRSKKSELEHRVQLAQAKKRTAQVLVLNRMEAGSAASGFRRLEDRILQLEAEADVSRIAAGISGLSGYGAAGGVGSGAGVAGVGSAASGAAFGYASHGAGSTAAAGLGLAPLTRDPLQQQRVEQELQRLKAATLPAEV